MDSYEVVELSARDMVNFALMVGLGAWLLASLLKGGARLVGRRRHTRAQGFLLGVLAVGGVSVIWSIHPQTFEREVYFGREPVRVQDGQWWTSFCAGAVLYLGVLAVLKPKQVRSEIRRRRRTKEEIVSAPEKVVSDFSKVVVSGEDLLAGEQATGGGARVFVSYHRKDIDEARAFRSALEVNGVAVRLVETSLGVSKDALAAALRQLVLDGCDTCIFFRGRSFHSSKWTEFEIATAARQGRLLILARTDGAPLAMIPNRPASHSTHSPGNSPGHFILECDPGNWTVAAARAAALIEGFRGPSMLRYLSSHAVIWGVLLLELVLVLLPLILWSGGEVRGGIFLNLLFGLAVLWVDQQFFRWFLRPYLRRGEGATLLLAADRVPSPAAAFFAKWGKAGKENPTYFRFRTTSMAYLRAWRRLQRLSPSRMADDHEAFESASSAPTPTPGAP